MVNRGKIPKPLRRFLVSRKGTAEVIGSVLFVVIIMFFFSSVYLWHDNATKSMNTLLADKLNSQIEVNWLDSTAQDTLLITNTGGVGTSLSRLWIITSQEPNAQHLYANLTNIDNTNQGMYVAPGATVSIKLQGSSTPIVAHWMNSAHINASVTYTRSAQKIDTFTVLTTTGNMASPQGTIKVVNQYNGNGGNGGSAPVGSVIVADFETFNYYTVTGSTLNSAQNGYYITPGNSMIAFSVSLTNMDENQRAVILNSESQMFFIGIKNNNMVTYIKAYIVNVQGNAIQNSFTTKTLQYNTPTTVYFASNTPATFTGFSLTSSNQVLPGTYPLNMALMGTFSDSASFGQNVPFVSIYINS